MCVWYGTAMNCVEELRCCSRYGTRTAGNRNGCVRAVLWSKGLGWSDCRMGLARKRAKRGAAGRRLARCFRRNGCASCGSLMRINHGKDVAGDVRTRKAAKKLADVAMPTRSSRKAKRCAFS